MLYSLKKQSCNFSVVFGSGGLFCDENPLRHQIKERSGELLPMIPVISTSFPLNPALKKVCGAGVISNVLT